jgi:hypothetical protein
MKISLLLWDFDCVSSDHHQITPFDPDVEAYTAPAHYWWGTEQLSALLEGASRVDIVEMVHCKTTLKG